MNQESGKRECKLKGMDGRRGVKTGKGFGEKPIREHKLLHGDDNLMGKVLSNEGDERDGEEKSGSRLNRGGSGAKDGKKTGVDKTRCP